MEALERRAFASDVRELRRMSAWWREWAAWAGLSTDTVDSGELCLNEAVGNIIQHGGSPQTKPITVDLAREADVVRMTISDELRPFNPLEHPEPEAPASLGEARAGGLGIHLIRLNAAAAHYRRDGGQNILTLVFTRAQAT